MDRGLDSRPSLLRRARRRFDAAGNVLVQMFMVIGGTMVVVALWAIFRLLGRRAVPPVRPE